MKKLSTRELAQYLALTKRTIQRRAIKEQWPYEERIGLGGTKRLYDFATLPENVKSKIVASIISRHESHSPADLEQLQHFAEDDTPFIAEYEKDPANWLAQHCFSQDVDSAELNKDYVKLGLLALARLYVAQAGVGKIKGFDEFCEKYNARELEIVEAIYSVISHISRITLLRWEKKEQEMAGANQVASPEAQQNELPDKELRQVFEEILMVSPNITAARMREHFLTFFPDKKIPDEAQLRLWIRQSLRH